MKKIKHCKKITKWLGFNFYRCVVCGQDLVVRRVYEKEKTGDLRNSDKNLR